MIELDLAGEDGELEGFAVDAWGPVAVSLQS
jgi:hypothetical protein